MSGILDQDQINSLIEAQTKFAELKIISESGKNKLVEIYEKTTGKICLHHLLDLSSVEKYINDIETKITTNSYYYESFKMLKESFEKRKLKRKG